MSIIKRKVGRPSKKQKRRREIVYGTIAGALIGVLVVSGYFIFNMTNLSSKEKKASTKGYKIVFSQSYYLDHKGNYPVYYIGNKVTRPDRKKVYGILEVYVNNKKYKSTGCIESNYADPFGYGIQVKDKDKVRAKYTLYTSNKCKTKILTKENNKTISASEFPIEVDVSQKRKNNKINIDYTLWPVAVKGKYIKIKTTDNHNQTIGTSSCSYVRFGSKYTRISSRAIKLFCVDIYNDKNCKIKKDHICMFVDQSK